MSPALRRSVGLCAALVCMLAAGHVLAAPSPFGVATPDTSSGPAFGGPLGPVFTWIALRQAEFYRGLTDTLSAIKADGSAAWLLLGLSFAYGVFHAAGPGHGKAVISSYLVASGETVRRGIAISFLAALAQAVTAVALVTVAAMIFRATALTMTRATEWLEIASYAAIAVLGAWLLWSKTFGGGHHHHHHHHFPGPAMAHAGALAEGHAHAHGHDDHHHSEAHHEDHHGHDHGHGHAHGHHGPVAAGAASTSRNPILRAWSTILAVGIRPCSGAIIVLVFALSQGLYAVGIASTFVMAIGTGLTVAVLATLAVSAKGLALRLAGTGSRVASGLLRGIEIVGALVVLLFGLLLLGGALQYGLPA